MSLDKRVLLIAVDDSDASENVLNWCLENMVKKDVDEIHFLHVIPVPMPEIVGAGAFDSIVTVEPNPQVDIEHIAQAKEFMKRRFVTKVASLGINYKVEIVHFLTDADSIGEAIVKRSEALNAGAVLMAKHQRGAISEFFLGSTTKYCISHCKAPLIILH